MRTHSLTHSLCQFSAVSPYSQCCCHSASLLFILFCFQYRLPFYLHLLSWFISVPASIFDLEWHHFCTLFFNFVRSWERKNERRKEILECANEVNFEKSRVGRLPEKQYVRMNTICIWIWHTHFHTLNTNFICHENNDKKFIYIQFEIIWKWCMKINLSCTTTLIFSNCAYLTTEKNTTAKKQKSWSLFRRRKFILRPHSQ